MYNASSIKCSYYWQEKHDLLRKDYDDLSVVLNLQNKQIADLKEEMGNLKEVCQSVCENKRTVDVYVSTLCTYSCGIKELPLTTDPLFAMFALFYLIYLLYIG